MLRGSCETIVFRLYSCGGGVGVGVMTCCMRVLLRFPLIWFYELWMRVFDPWWLLWIRHEVYFCRVPVIYGPVMKCSSGVVKSF